MRIFFGKFVGGEVFLVGIKNMYVPTIVDKQNTCLEEMTSETLFIRLFTIHDAGFATNVPCLIGLRISFLGSFKG